MSLEDRKGFGSYVAFVVCSVLMLGIVSLAGCEDDGGPGDLLQEDTEYYPYVSETSTTNETSGDVEAFDPDEVQDYLDSIMTNYSEYL